MRPEPRHVLITGASSGIGEALALIYAAPGVALSLSGRDQSRLAQVGDACRTRGAEVTTGSIDVTDRARMREWVAARDAAVSLDLVIANAGISGGTAGIGDPEEQMRRILMVNVDGVLNTVLPAVGLMRPRHRGQIAVISSLAGFRAVGGSPAYEASKAAVRVFGEGLRSKLASDGIMVSVVCPGFVESRMTAANHFKMPFFMATPKAAAIIKRGLAQNRGRISFPWPLVATLSLVMALPNFLGERITNYLARSRT